MVIGGLWQSISIYIIYMHDGVSEWKGLYASSLIMLYDIPIYVLLLRQ